MSNTTRVFVYGASGYTGKLVAESLALRNIPFVFAGRNAQRLQDALEVVESRVGRAVDAEIATANNSGEE